MGSSWMRIWFCLLQRYYILSILMYKIENPCTNSKITTSYILAIKNCMVTIVDLELIFQLVCANSIKPNGMRATSSWFRRYLIHCSYQRLSTCGGRFFRSSFLLHGLVFRKSKSHPLCHLDVSASAIFLPEI